MLVVGQEVGKKKHRQEFKERDQEEEKTSSHSSAIFCPFFKPVHPERDSSICETHSALKKKQLSLSLSEYTMTHVSSWLLSVGENTARVTSGAFKAGRR